MSLLGNSIKLKQQLRAVLVQPAQRPDGALIAMRPVESGAGEQLDVATVDPRVHSVPVVLDLVHPGGTGRRLIDEARELRLDPLQRVRRRSSALILAQASAMPVYLYPRAALGLLADLDRMENCLKAFFRRPRERDIRTRRALSAFSYTPPN